MGLRQQEFVELIKEQKRIEAVRHARKYFSSVEPPYLHRVQQLMGLLAFTADTTVYPYVVTYLKYCNIIRIYVHIVMGT